MNCKTIQGVNINLDHVAEFTKFADFKNDERGFYDHLKGKDRDAALKEAWTAAKGGKTPDEND